tara:strand:+ start:4588 stop:5127 length:540 start_codon:yes stop_codon:yes gene_type:complete
MKGKTIAMLTIIMIFQSFASANDPIPPKTGFPGCAIKVLDQYPGFLLSVEAEGNSSGDFFYEFDVFVKDKENPKNSKEIEVECDPVTLKLTDIEEEVNPSDPRFIKAVKLTKEDAEKAALAAVSGIVVDREFSIEDGKPLFEFDIFDKKTGKEVEVEVDGASGRVIEKEIEFFEVGVDS